jgi:hypothetical protein
MIRIPKSVLTSASIVLAAGALTLAVPRAAHAVAALLVQVTNTSANPAVVQSTTTQASQLVVLLASNVKTSPVQFEVEGFTGLRSTLVIPAGQSLIVTDVDLYSADCSATTHVNIGNFAWATPTGTNSAHYQYRSGFVVQDPTVLTASTPVVPCPSGELEVYLHGYMTSN